MTADDLSSLLSPIRERAAEVRRMRHPVAALIQSEAPASLLRLLAVSVQDLGALLAAGEAALKLADDWDAEGLVLRAGVHQDCARELRAAITAELAKGTGDA